jgi:hypothetical protein
MHFHLPQAIRHPVMLTLCVSTLEVVVEVDRHGQSQHNVWSQGQCQQPWRILVGDIPTPSTSIALVRLPVKRLLVCPHWCHHDNDRRGSSHHLSAKLVLTSELVLTIVIVQTWQMHCPNTMQARGPILDTHSYQGWPLEMIHCRWQGAPCRCPEGHSLIEDKGHLRIMHFLLLLLLLLLLLTAATSYPHPSHLFFISGSLLCCNRMTLLIPVPIILYQWWIGGGHWGLQIAAEQQWSSPIWNWQRPRNVAPWMLTMRWCGRKTLTLLWCQRATAQSMSSPSVCSHMTPLPHLPPPLPSPLLSPQSALLLLSNLIVVARLP